MTFKLNLNSIDTNFPVPGVDNPSQGFRDNFSIIENNFVELDDVVGTLDEVSVRLNAVNDFNGQGTLENVTLKKTKQIANTSNETGTSTDTIDCNWDEAVFYVIKVSNSIEPLTINLKNWPNSGYAKMTLLLTKTDATDRTIIWTAPPLALLQPATIKKLNFPNLLILDVEDPTMIEAVTYDAGETVLLRYVGKFE